MLDQRVRMYRDLSQGLLDETAHELLPGWKYTERQMSAAVSEADELLFGGAAGGGKSGLILALGRLNHRRALALRKSFPHLKKTLISRSVQMFGQAHKYFNRSDHIWQWPSGNVFQFGNMQNEDSIGNYLSTEYDYIAPDELTQFSILEYISIRRSLRTDAHGQRTRTVAATNPGGIGNDWVMERWGAWLDEAHEKPAAPGELRWYCRIGDRDTAVPGPWPIKYKGEDLIPLSRTFIPAKVSDNPHINREYIAQLQSLSEPFRSQQLHGDWKAGQVEDANQVIPRKWLRAAMNRWQPRKTHGPAEIGTDIAAGGTDQTVLARRWGNWWGQLQKVSGALTPLGSDVLALMLPELAAGSTANCDAIGVGLATIQAARDAGLMNRVIPIQFAGEAPYLDRSRTMGFANVRAWGFWNLRELLDPDRILERGEELPEIPPDPELFTDLTAPKFELRGGRILIESKEKIKKRIGRSPDCGDSVVLSLAAPRGFDMERYSNSVLAGDPTE